ncbi:MAG: hypothetical protein CBD16_07790 [Betaproteobacteria bacterium TMED156]|nr:MAG: hypothetical protein CBD16_07790 [Betaproteobacteria bacterium TMED156]|tara:strand:- start:974 stop:1366 length:393 start_codon:yes stop_codon:yes gene_type:complete
MIDKYIQNDKRRKFFIKTKNLSLLLFFSALFKRNYALSCEIKNNYHLKSSVINNFLFKSPIHIVLRPGENFCYDLQANIIKTPSYSQIIILKNLKFKMPYISLGPHFVYHNNNIHPMVVFSTKGSPKIVT